MDMDELLTQSIPAQAVQEVLSPPSGGLEMGRILAGRFRIVEAIGRGGMGEVYRAEDLVLQQPVALKFLPELVAADAEHRARMLDEVRAARQVTHPNVCRVHDVMEADGRFFLAMELIDGEDLASLLRRVGRLNQEKGLQIARQITAALAAVHGRGILHRDLKPANIMIDGRGEVRLTDFGLAVTSARAEQALVAGTPAYMPAELRAGGKASVQSDLYALGLVFLELFTGRRLEAVDSSHPSRPHLDAESHLPPDLQPALAHTIRWCLTPDSAGRPPSALAVLAALPGGDPLAALVAAGQTPSPETVAQAGGLGALRPAVAWCCFGLLALLMATAIWLMDRVSLHRYAGLQKSPSLLVERAQRVLWKLGYDAPIADSAFRFQYVTAVRNEVLRDPSPERLAVLKDARPPLIEFQYRVASRTLMPLNRWSVVYSVDPAPTQPGMATVRLDLQGRLLHFLAVPFKDLEPSTRPMDWNAVLAEAGLDPSQLRPVTPRLPPPLHTTATAAWTQGPLRFEAAERQGRLVWFTTVPDPAPATAQGPSPTSVLSQITDHVFDWFYIVILPALSLLLAYRNWRRDRIDLRGASRLAGVVFISWMLFGLLSAHHGGELTRELWIFQAVLPDALLGAMKTWLGYLAIEPYLRHWWPNTLISWSRILAGGLRNPRVGRDLLVGLAAGWGGVLLLALSHQLAGRPYVAINVPDGQLATALAYVVFTPSDMSFYFLVVGVLLTFLRSLTHRTAVTVPFVVAAISVLGVSLLNQSHPIAMDYGVCGLLGLLAVVLLLKLGIFAVLAFFLPLESLGFPYSTALGNWAAMTMVGFIFLSGALGLFGLVTSVGAQPLFGSGED